MENTPSVCLICLDTDSIMYSMSEHKLDVSYERLTGYPLFEVNNLEHTLCTKCTLKLTTFEQFRDKSLRARTLMMELVRQHKVITTDHIRTLLAGDWACESHCDLHMLDGSPDPEKVSVKTEPSVKLGSWLHESWDSTDAVEVKFEGSADCLGEGGAAPGISDPLWADGTATNDETNMGPIKAEQDETTNKCEPVFQIKIEQSSLHSDDTRQEQCTHTPSNIYDARRKLHKSQTEQNKSRIVTKNTIRISDSIMRAQDSEKCFECQQCSYKGSKRSNLSRHMKTHSDERPFICDLCSYKFSKKSTLKMHLTTHTGEKPYSCELCPYKCSRKTSLMRHMRTHSDDKPFDCSLCTYKCSNKTYLMLHMRTHTGEKLYSCDLCSYKCSKKFVLVRHTRMHTGEKPFVCELCLFKCADKSNLLQHMRTHTGEKPYMCDLCPYKCSQKVNLVNHKKTHTGEKPYVCELCPYKSAVKSNLVAHIRTHTGEKPYACELCSYKGALKSSFSRHMTTHTSEKPFLCELCPYKCSRKSRLVQHMKTHSGEKRRRAPGRKSRDAVAAETSEPL